MSAADRDLWVPFASVAVFVIVLNLAWFFRAPAMFHIRAFVWARVFIFALPGAGMAIYSAVVMPHLVAASQHYQTDPSCLPGSMSDRALPPGPCRVDRVALTNAYQTASGRGGPHYYVTVNFADGTATRVELAYIHDGYRLFHGVLATPGTAARAQVFEGTIIMLTSDRGNATTPDLPQSRAQRAQVLGAVGVALLICAFLSLLLSWGVVSADDAVAA